MRKVKSAEREKAGNIYCSFCKPIKVDAIWRKTGLANFKTDFACEKHKGMIREDSGSTNEADHQTWMRL